VRSQSPRGNAGRGGPRAGGKVSSPRRDRRAAESRARRVFSRSLHEPHPDAGSVDAESRGRGKRPPEAEPACRGAFGVAPARTGAAKAVGLQHAAVEPCRAGCRRRARGNGAPDGDLGHAEGGGRSRPGSRPLARAPGPGETPRRFSGVYGLRFRFSRDPATRCRSEAPSSRPIAPRRSAVGEVGVRPRRCRGSRNIHFTQRRRRGEEVLRRRVAPARLPVIIGQDQETRSAPCRGTSGSHDIITSGLDPQAGRSWRDCVEVRDHAPGAAASRPFWLRRRAARETAGSARPFGGRVGRAGGRLCADRRVGALGPRLASISARSAGRPARGSRKSASEASASTTAASGGPDCGPGSGRRNSSIGRQPQTASGEHHDRRAGQPGGPCSAGSRCRREGRPQDRGRGRPGFDAAAVGGPQPKPVASRWSCDPREPGSTS